MQILRRSCTACLVRGAMLSEGAWPVEVGCVEVESGEVGSVQAGWCIGDKGARRKQGGNTGGGIEKMR